MRLRRLLLIGIGIHAAMAGEFSWVNVETYPDDLENTGDGWSAVRMEDKEFVSHRIACDDIVLEQRTQITEIGYWNVDLGEPIIIAFDWYIYADDNDGLPGTLLYSGEASEYTREDSGLDNKSFGTLYLTTMNPEGVTLDPGAYFVAFRSFQKYNPGGNGKNTIGALTTRWANGEQRAYWNFEVYGDGGVHARWYKMQEFNGVKDNEWAFYVKGATEEEFDRGDVNCDGAVDFGDIDAFVTALTGQEAYEEQYPDCDYALTDINCDDSVDFDDIDGFVECIVNGGCADCP
jgi:hypothetical protein